MTRTFLGRALCAIFAAAFVSLPVGVLAQSAQGGLRGTLKDTQGVIPGVAVTLISEATGFLRETVTNEAGEYSFPAVDPATYISK